VKIHIHKIASSTLPCRLEREVEVGSEIDARAGSVLVVRALQEKSVYDKLELETGRMAKVSRDDVIAGALGSRRALRGFVGDVPQELRPGDRIHILNLGGVLGMCTSRLLDVGEPLRVEVIGQAMRNGEPLNIRDGALPPVSSQPDGPPLVVVAGTCMAAGKTLAACEIIQKLTSRGVRLAGAKPTGVACLRDTLNMLDHGAVDAVSFLDAGHASTVGIDDLPAMTKGLFAKLAESSLDAIVVEMGDGIIGGYGVRSLLIDPEIRARTRAWVCCANDLVAAWGAVQQFRELRIHLDVMAGSATDNEVGSAYIARELGVPAINARTEPHRLADAIERKLR
jgi:hypothetical protein